MQKKSDALSVLSLIFGLIGLFTILYVIGVIPCIVGLILGIIALSKSQNKGLAIAGIVTSSIGICLIAFILAVTLLSSLSSNESDKGNNSDTVAKQATKDVATEQSTTEISGSTYVEPTEQPQENESEWADEFTPITDFRYSIDENNKTITLTRYEGNRKKILLSPVYSLDGVDYSLISMGDDACFLCEAYITSVIIPEGVTEISASCFNSCSSLEYLYLPSTLSSIPRDFFSYVDNYEVYCNSQMSLPEARDTVVYHYVPDDTSSAAELGESSGRAVNGLLAGFNSANEENVVVKIYFGGTDEQWKDLTSY